MSGKVTGSCARPSRTVVEVSELDFLCSNLAIPSFIDSWLAAREERKKHPNYMQLNGILCFCGEQGSGKTLSAVNYVEAVAQRYKKCQIVTNIDLDIDVKPSRIHAYEGVEQMLTFDNGEYGVIFFIDEMHIEFNSLESKGMDIHTFELVSQQRKMRKHIVGTSQVFGRLAKPFREQFKYVVLCDRMIGSLFRQQAFSAQNIPFEDDIRTLLKPRCTRWYIAGPDMYSKYDTSQVVRRVRDHGF